MRLRRLVIAAHPYYWRSSSRRLSPHASSPYAVEVLIYRAGYRHSPLRLLFREDDNEAVTDNPTPGRWLFHDAGAGMGWFCANAPRPVGSKPPAVNFNRPAVVARLLQCFLAAGWEPEKSLRPFEVRDALKYLNSLQLAALSVG